MLHTTIPAVLPVAGVEAVTSVVGKDRICSVEMSPADQCLGAVRQVQGIGTMVLVRVRAAVDGAAACSMIKHFGQALDALVTIAP